MFFELLKRMGWGFATLWVVSALASLSVVGLIIYILVKIAARI